MDGRDSSGVGKSAVCDCFSSGILEAMNDEPKVESSGVEVQTTRAPAKEPSKARQILDAAKARQDMKRQSRWVKKGQGVYGQ